MLSLLQKLPLNKLRPLFIVWNSFPLRLCLIFAELTAHGKLMSSQLMTIVSREYLSPLFK